MPECETDGNKDHVRHHTAQTSIDPKTNVASRNEREENIINIWGFETPLRKRGVNTVLRYERSCTVWFRLEIWKLKEANCNTEKGRCLLCAGDGTESIYS